MRMYTCRMWYAINLLCVYAILQVGVGLLSTAYDRSIYKSLFRHKHGSKAT